MRALGALLGALIVPLSYSTIRDAGHSRIAATLTALAICFENGLITNNRLILLDSYLLFFTAFTVFSWTRFYNKTSPFSLQWWFWLLCTGVGSGCAVSSKWFGFFTVATIGISAAKQLWEILGDLRVSKRHVLSHIFARAICLIIIPTMVYVGVFYVHIGILNGPGPGESYMERETQNELRGYEPVDTPLPITYGSIITMRQLETTGGYLHSHKANYPEGSQQQQVTLYPHHDDNNWWRVLKADIFKEPIKDLLANDNATWLEYVRAGDLIRLEHVVTAPRKLHSHDIPAPITDTTYHKEVSGYGFLDHVGDSNDHWRVQIDENKQYPEAGQVLQSRRSKFRLFHVNQDCHLFASFERLPDWGFEQQEVSCIQEGLKPKTMWKIEETENKMLPEDSPMEPEHRQTFLQKFNRLHKIMWITLFEKSEPHPFASRPYTWPTLLTFIAFWQSEQTQIILLGNPLVYWSSSLAVLTFITFWGFFQLRDKRGYKDSFNGVRAFYENSAGFFVVGWIIHYLPFFRMERQLFIQHYMPALYFAILTMGVNADVFMRRFPQFLKMFILITACGCIAYTYYIYSPLTYGEAWSVGECENASLLDQWHLSCARYAPLGSPERDSLVENIENSITEQSAATVYVDENGKRIPLEDVPLQLKETETIEEEEEEEVQEIVFPNSFEKIEDEQDFEDEYDDEYDDDDEDEEDDEPVPTEAPVIEIEPEFVDGKEVYGEDDDDEDEWPKTVYGVDPEADEDDEDPQPLTTREIPSTRHVEL
ncbi:unnamed protein product [Mucor hiemalis]